MKKKYSLSRLTPGAFFTEDAFSEGDMLFALANTPILEKDIAGLTAWGLTDVYTEGELKAPAKNAALSQSGDIELRKVYASYIQRLNDIMEAIAHDAKLEPKHSDALAADIVDTVEKKPSEIISLVLSADTQTYNLAKAGVHCAILSLVIAKAIKLPSRQTYTIAVGALLHDIGMLRVPDTIIGKKGILSQEEKQKMRSHPLISCTVINRDLHYPEEISAIALQHHERWDGEGYPGKLSGTAISLNARIVSVADAFEAMVSRKPYRNSMIGYAAMKCLLSDNSRRFDPDVLKAFVRSMGIYPIGSIVVLNNSAIAKVRDINTEAPLRPRLITLVDTFGTHFKNDSGAVIDLLTERTLFIARAVDPSELSAQ